MMQFSVQSDIEKKLASIASLAEAKKLRTATYMSLTQTAQSIQQEVRYNMGSPGRKGRFTIRKDWTLKGIRIIPATAEKMVATVYSKDDYMSRQEAGGIKQPTAGKTLAVPGSLIRRTKRQSIRQADLPKNLGGKVSKIKIDGKEYLALKKARKGANGQKLRILYALIKQARIKPALKLGEDGMRIAGPAFQFHFKRNLTNLLAELK